ncbi:hypothetical protein NKR23_g10366 [Pleurostoma richardsiae]|uniref:Zn(2)-C6 fungal-type domain-containing protein n=1 Tax=Pleurostoma richardsiae TaxID=41990 RepID=A0AA38R350_9PEZI|nr:hypothetical protein NKR23_g10366 [Pleurostoma richardsiae]
MTQQEQVQDASQRRSRKRRSHRKSRLGCGNCKRRRIKCDEARPICQNCVNRGVCCDFDAPPPAPTDTASPGEVCFQVKFRLPQQEQRPLERQYVCGNCGAASASTDAQEAVPDASIALCASGLDRPAGLSVRDLELLHHFLVHTSSSLADDYEAQVLWQVTVPKLGFSHSFLLHNLLALSALHLATMDPERRDSHIARAEFHHIEGLRGLTTMMACLDGENAGIVGLSASLVCFYSFGVRPRPGEYLVFSEDGGEPEWFSFLRGVRSVNQSAELLGSPGPTPANDDKGRRSPPVTLSSLPLRQPAYEEPMERLREFVLDGTASSDEDEIQTYIAAVDSMASTFASVYLPREALSSSASKPFSHLIFAWLYLMSDSLACYMRERRPTALIILAHYAVLLKETECFWFMDGWAAHIVAGVAHDLPDEYKPLLDWPLEDIGGHI